MVGFWSKMGAEEKRTPEETESIAEHHRSLIQRGGMAAAIHPTARAYLEKTIQRGGKGFTISKEEFAEKYPEELETRGFEREPPASEKVELEAPEVLETYEPKEEGYAEDIPDEQHRSKEDSEELGMLTEGSQSAEEDK